MLLLFAIIASKLGLDIFFTKDTDVLDQDTDQLLKMYTLWTD